MPAGVAYYERRHHQPTTIPPESVEFGVALPGRGPMASPDQVLKIAAKADALRLRLDLRHRSRRAPGLDGPLGLSVLDDRSAAGRRRPGLPRAARDARLPGPRHLKRARLGTSVLVIPYRHPVLVPPRCWPPSISSRAAASSSAPAWAGCARSSRRSARRRSRQRGAVTDEYVRLMRTAWTTDPVTFDGRYVSVRDVHVLPKPVQPGGIPVWIGGHTDAALRARPPCSATAGTRSACASRDPASPEEYAERARSHTRGAARPDAIRSRSRCRCACRWRCDPRGQGPGGRPAALPGHGRAGHRRHPRLRRRPASRTSSSIPPSRT